MSLQDLLAWAPVGSPEQALAGEVDFDRLPAHVAVIMDGNGRWAAQRHLPRVEGHRAGIDAVRDVVETSARLGLDVLTLYAFSVENWKRPRAEVAVLMGLLKRYLRLELENLQANDIRFQGIGRPEELPVDGQRELDEGQERTRANGGMLFNNCFCTNSLCEPSRAAILTGTYNHINEVTTIGAHIDNRQENVAKILQRNGYQTAIVGKWHLGQGPAHWPTGFDYWNILQGQGPYFDPEMVCNLSLIHI